LPFGLECAKPLVMTTFRGTYTALVTPFVDAADFPIDWVAFDQLIEDQIAGGVEGLVPCGTTGESPAFDAQEHLAVIARTVERTKGRVTVLAGTGSNSTKHAVHLSKEAVARGANAVMVVVPYYNKPTQEGLLRHFVTVAQAVTCPVVVYNVPGRTSIDLAADTLLKIQKEAPNVVATKEATGNVLRAQEIVIKSEGKMTVLSGDDGLTLPMIAVGAQGVISVTSNLLPKLVADATRAALAGDIALARKLHLDLVPMHEAMFLEANPGPVKAALAMRKKMNAAVRLPLVTTSEATRQKLAAVLARVL
jgi:4-hydroxy-tetrahydrodipicolinate synthase